jgi:hypothetical protein
LIRGWTPSVMGTPRGGRLRGDVASLRTGDPEHAQGGLAVDVLLDSAQHGGAACQPRARLQLSCVTFARSPESFASPRAEDETLEGADAHADVRRPVIGGFHPGPGAGRGRTATSSAPPRRTRAARDDFVSAHLAPYRISPRRRPAGSWSLGEPPGWLTLATTASSLKRPATPSSGAASRIRTAGSWPGWTPERHARGSRCAGTRPTLRPRGRREEASAMARIGPCGSASPGTRCRRARSRWSSRPAWRPKSPPSPPPVRRRPASGPADPTRYPSGTTPLAELDGRYLSTQVARGFTRHVTEGSAAFVVRVRADGRRERRLTLRAFPERAGNSRSGRTSAKGPAHRASWRQIHCVQGVATVWRLSLGCGNNAAFWIWSETFDPADGRGRAVPYPRSA